MRTMEYIVVLRPAPTPHAAWEFISSSTSASNVQIDLIRASQWLGGVPNACSDQKLLHKRAMENQGV